MSTNKIDSNVVGLAYAEEASYGVLPGASEADAVWFPLDPNEYSDFGGEVQTVRRNPINASRQLRKGVVTDLDASGGIQQDLTQDNLTRLMQGFMFADTRERPGNAPLNGSTGASTVTVTNIDGTANEIDLDTGDGAQFTVGDLLRTSGFVNAGNNQNILEVTSISTDNLAVDVTDLVDESYTVGKLETVGHQYPSGDLSLALTGNTLTLDSVAGFAAQNYAVGEWIFIGGDDAGDRFDSVIGYARIEAVAANSLTLKEPTFTPGNDAGAGKTVRVFTGVYLRNEKDPALIKRRTYNLERTLGDDGSGTQSEYLTGSVANEFTFNITAADKLMVDLSFVSKENQLRDGATGVKAGNRDAAIDTGSAFNTSSDVFQQRLFIHGDAPTPASLFAFVMEGTLAINNNATGNKAIGQLGNFEVTVGDFEVSGELEVYFATVAAVSAVKNNSDVGYNIILAKENAGIVHDIPLLSLGGGRVTVEKDEPIMLPLEKMGAENDNGYTLASTYFSYLPNAAMPTVA